MFILQVITWILFFGLSIMSVYWLRKAWLIGVKKDYSYVALKKGLPPKNPEKYAKFSFFINLIAGLVLLAVVLLVIIIGLKYETWTAIGGVTIWMKIFASFILSRHAHMKK